MANFVSSITLAFKDAFSSGFKQAGESLAGMKGALEGLNANSGMTSLAAGLSITAAQFSAVNDKLSAMLDVPSQLAGTFETSMKNIQAITGKSAQEIDALSESLLTLGGKSAAGPLAVANAFNDVAGGIAMVSPGVDLLDVQMQVLTNAMALAEGGQANLGTAAEGLTKVMNAYGFTMGTVEEANERAAWASDVMTQAVGMGLGSLEEFVSSLAPLSGVASSVGVGFDELGSVMAYMTSTTDDAASAGTKMGMFMSALMKPSTDLAKALESIGISSGSAMLQEYGLAESALLVNKAFNGNQDAIAQAMGNQNAMKFAISMTSGAYSDFASQFGSTMKGVTAAAQAVQAQSYESKVARLNAATDSLKISIGDDINSIKGFFVDMGTNFITHVAAPILSSPIGGVFESLTAVVAIGAQGLLSFGSTALTATSQMVTLMATLQNSGGFMHLFKSSFTGLKGEVTAVLRPIAAMGASLWTALLPVLPIVLGVTAAVAAIAGAAYLVHKHFDKIRAFLAGVSDWVLVAVAAIFPIIGIPALIIKHWDTVKAFFVGLWVQVTEVFTAVWTGIVNFFVSLWNGVPGFFSSLWNGITAVVASVANWFGGVWGQVAGAFAGVWTWVKDLFVSIWENIKGVVLGFVEWLSPVIDAIIAPFQAIGNVIGGIVGAVKGWMGETVDKGNTKLAEMSAAKAAAKPAEAASLAKPSDMGAIAAPSFGTIAAPAMSTTMAGAGGNALVAEHLAAASRKGIAASDISYAASDAFMGAGTRTASGDLADFSEAARPARNMVADLPWNKPEARTEKPAPRTIKIENLYLQADDAMSLLNFVRQLECAVLEPVGVAV
ncbi:MAG: phage tail tape measure protein [Treponematales bacterium]